MKEHKQLTKDYESGYAWSVLDAKDDNQYFRVRRWGVNKGLEIKQWVYIKLRFVVFCERFAEHKEKK